MPTLHEIAERIGDRYFDPHLTLIAEDADDSAILIDIQPELLGQPLELVELMKQILGDAGPYQVRFGFSPPAQAAGSSAA